MSDENLPDESPPIENLADVPPEAPADEPQAPPDEPEPPPDDPEPPPDELEPPPGELEPPPRPNRTLSFLPDPVSRNLSSIVSFSMMITGNGTAGLLQRIRRPLADYQQERGIPRSEMFSFVSLVTALAQHSWTAVLTILSTLYQLLPLVDALLYLFRFTLDKLIDIYSTDDKKERMTKIGIFVGELLVILLVVYFIWSLILMPIISVAFYVIGRIWAFAYYRKKSKAVCTQVCPKKPAC